MRDAHLWPVTARVGPGGRLEVGGCDVTGLAREHGTPLYVLDEATLRSACRAYRSALSRHYPAPSTVHYAGKSLLNLAVARLLLEEGVGFDVSSGGELYVALRAGVPAERLHLHGNAKPELELLEALEAGAGGIVVDNLDELERLSRLADGRHPPQAVLLRVTPEVVVDTHAHVQTGQATSKFGLPLDALDDAAGILARSPSLDYRGLHFHLGSQIRDVAPYARAVEAVLDGAALLRDRYGLELAELSPGGGFGAAYLPGERAMEPDEAVASIARAVVEGCRARGLRLPRLALEPGRSVSGRAGIAVYEVLGTKRLPRRDSKIAGYLHVDGGMGDNPRPALYSARYSALLANRADAAVEETVHVAGRYCESGDVLIRDARLPSASPGDLVALATAGAYTISMASNYNLTPRPAVLLAADGQARLVQRRETYKDLVRRDIEPALPGRATRNEAV